MAIEKAPEGYGITGDIGGPTEWYSGPPVSEGGRTVTVSMTEGQFGNLRDIAYIEEMLCAVKACHVSSFGDKCGVFAQISGFSPVIQHLYRYIVLNRA